MAKSEKFKPFSGVVCERIRRLQAYITKCEAARESAFDTRDHLRNEIALCGKADAEKIEHLKAQRNDAIDQTEVLAEGIKWARRELKKVIENADEPELFEDAGLNMPNFEQEIIDKIKRKAEKEEAEPNDPDQLKLAGSDDSIENYLPGQWRNQNGAMFDIGDFEAIQAIALEAGHDVDITPVFSDSWGCRVNFTRQGKSIGSLTYSGPITEKTKRRQKPKKPTGKPPAKRQ